MVKENTDKLQSDLKKLVIEDKKEENKSINNNTDTEKTSKSKSDKEIKNDEKQENKVDEEKNVSKEDGEKINSKEDEQEKIKKEITETDTKKGEKIVKETETKEGEKIIKETETKDEQKTISKEDDGKIVEDKTKKSIFEQDTEKTNQNLESSKMADSNILDKVDEQKEDKKVPYIHTETKKTTEIFEQHTNEIFNGSGKLYLFCTKNKKPIERGEGELIIEFMESTNLYRIRMIRNAIKMFACNHYIEPTSSFSKHSAKNAFIWTSTKDQRTEIIEKSDTPFVFIIKFDNDLSSETFADKFNKAKEHNLAVTKTKKQ